jgi:hypothetical protein
MKDIVIKTLELDGKKITYTNQTEFLVQVGKEKSSYKTKYKFTGNLNQAVSYYCAINIGLGYKKRLMMPSAKQPLLARHFS